MGQRQVYIKIVAITLVVVILFQNFSKILSVAEFVLNRSYYAQVECLYRDNPDVMCNAKCVLADIIDTTNDFRGTSTISATDISFDKFIVKSSLLVQKIENFPKIDISNVILDSYSYLFEFHILKPPIVIIL